MSLLVEVFDADCFEAVVVFVLACAACQFAFSKNTGVSAETQQHIKDVEAGLTQA
jgi:hypothetical protein